MAKKNLGQECECVVMDVREEECISRLGATGRFKPPRKALPTAAKLHFPAVSKLKQSSSHFECRDISRFSRSNYCFFGGLPKEIFPLSAPVVGSPRLPHTHTFKTGDGHSGLSRRVETKVTMGVHRNGAVSLYLTLLSDDDEECIPRPELVFFGEAIT